MRLILALLAALLATAPAAAQEFNSAHGETMAATDRIMGYDASRAATGTWTAANLTAYLDTLYLAPNGDGSSLTSVNAATLDGSTWAAPAAIGSGTPAAGTFTTVAGTEFVSGAEDGQRFFDATNSADTDTTDWGAAEEGRFWFNATTDTFRYWDGGAAVDWPGGTGGSFSVFTSETDTGGTLSASDFGAGGLEPLVVTAASTQTLPAATANLYRPLLLAHASGNVVLRPSGGSEEITFNATALGPGYDANCATPGAYTLVGTGANTWRLFGPASGCSQGTLSYTALTPSPTSWDPADGTQGDPAADQTITYTATGSVTFTGISIVTTGNYVTDLGTGTCTGSTSLTNGQTCTINLRFSYTLAGGPYSDTLRVTSDAGTVDVPVGPVTVVASGSTLIAQETFDATGSPGTDLTWTPGPTSGFNPNYTGVILEGTESLRIGNHDINVTSWAGSAVDTTYISGIWQLESETSAASEYMIHIEDSSGNDLMRVRLYWGTDRYYPRFYVNGGVTEYGNASALNIDAGETWCWRIRYTKGTGANAEWNVSFVEDTGAGCPAWDAGYAKTDATDTAQAAQLRLDTHAAYWVMDDIRVDDAEITY